MADTNKTLTIILAIVITLSAVVILYVNLPQSNEDNETTEGEIILTVVYDDQELTYTLSQLEEFTSYTREGGKINKKSTVTGPYEYTGVKISTLLNELSDLPDSYNITATSSDGYKQEYSYEQITGTVTLYNETRNETGQGSLTMIITYKEEGEYITDPEYGPVMIAFVDDYYTDSALWARMLEKLEITSI